MDIVEVTLKPLFRGDPRTIVFNILDEDGAPVNLSVASWTSTIREFETSTVGHTMTVDTSYAATGALRIDIPGELSRELGRRFVGDLQGSVYGTVVLFRADIIPDVTRGATEPDGGAVDVVNLIWGGELGTTVSSTVRAVLLGTVVELDDHVADTTPHPVYDDAHSFRLIFENGLI